MHRTHGREPAPKPKRCSPREFVVTQGSSEHSVIVHLQRRQPRLVAFVRRFIDASGVKKVVYRILHSSFRKKLNHVAPRRIQLELLKSPNSLAHTA